MSLIGSLSKVRVSSDTAASRSSSSIATGVSVVGRVERPLEIVSHHLLHVGALKLILEPVHSHLVLSWFAPCVILIEPLLLTRSRPIVVESATATLFLGSNSRWESYLILLLHHLVVLIATAESSAEGLLACGVAAAPASLLLLARWEQDCILVFIRWLLSSLVVCS